MFCALYVCCMLPLLVAASGSIVSHLMSPGCAPAELWSYLDRCPDKVIDLVDKLVLGEYRVCVRTENFERFILDYLIVDKLDIKWKWAPDILPRCTNHWLGIFLSLFSQHYRGDQIIADCILRFFISNLNAVFGQGLKCTKKAMSEFSLTHHQLYMRVIQYCVQHEKDILCVPFDRSSHLIDYCNAIYEVVRGASGDPQIAIFHLRQYLKLVKAKEPACALLKCAVGRRAATDEAVYLALLERCSLSEYDPVAKLCRLPLLGEGGIIQRILAKLDAHCLDISTGRPLRGLTTAFSVFSLKLLQRVLSAAIEQCSTTVLSWLRCNYGYAVTADMLLERVAGLSSNRATRIFSLFKPYIYDYQVVFMRALREPHYGEEKRRRILRAGELINPPLRTLTRASIRCTVQLTEDLILAILLEYADLTTRIFIVPILCRRLAEYNLWRLFDRDRALREKVAHDLSIQKPYLAGLILAGRIEKLFILKYCISQTMPKETLTAMFSSCNPALWELLFEAFGGTRDDYWKGPQQRKILDFMMSNGSYDSESEFVMAILTKANQMLPNDQLCTVICNLLSNDMVMRQSESIKGTLSLAAFIHSPLSLALPSGSLPPLSSSPPSQLLLMEPGRLLDWSTRHSQQREEDVVHRDTSSLDPELVNMILGEDRIAAMRSLAGRVGSTRASPGDESAALARLEEIVEEIDSAEDMERMGMWGAVLEAWKLGDNRAQVLSVFGTAAQNSTAVQQALFGMGVLGDILAALREGKSERLVMKALFALSSLVQNHRAAFEAFLEADGLEALETARRSFPASTSPRIEHLLEALRLQFEDLDV